VSAFLNKRKIYFKKICGKILLHFNKKPSCGFKDADNRASCIY
jgi:hypothetical protein